MSNGVRLEWDGKNDAVLRVSLPFQTIETINESRPDRESATGGLNAFDTEPRAEKQVKWRNKLIWGDNKLILGSLLKEYAGKIKLIYIDPPFATGQDFSVDVEVGSVKEHKEPNIIEQKAYNDTWGKGLGSFLQMLRERLVLMRELLAEDGSIYVHCDQTAGHYIKIVMDDVFGTENFRNEIVWCYSGPSATKIDFPRKHDNIFRYTKSDHWTFNTDTIRVPYSAASVYAIKKKYEGYYTPEEMERFDHGKIPEDWWMGMDCGHMSAKERLGFPTQKTELELERIIQASSNEGDLIADFFCGSGTTLAVAEKLKRRWIGADLGRFAIHTTRKRLLDLQGCTPFEILNLGKYERQRWDSTNDKDVEDYYRFVVELCHGERTEGYKYLHGRLVGRMIHVGPMDAPVTEDELRLVLDECKDNGIKNVDILGWEFEMGLNDRYKSIAEEYGLTNDNLALKYIPDDVLRNSKDVEFHELSYLDVEIVQDNDKVMVELKKLVFPHPSSVPEEARDKIDKWSDYVDYWAVDWDYKEDTFHNQWQAYRTKQDRGLDLKSETHMYASKGVYKVLVKVIDIFGVDTTKVVEVVV